MQKYVNYYSNSNGIQLGELINELPFALSCVIKYLWRYDKKGTPEKDLEKALHYVEELSYYPYEYQSLKYWGDFAKDSSVSDLFYGCMGWLIDFVTLDLENDLVKAKQKIKTLIQAEIDSLPKETDSNTNLAKNVIEVLDKKARLGSNNQYQAWIGFQNGNGDEIGTDIEDLILQAKQILK